MISINGVPTHSLDQIIRNGDVVTHTLHRHEPPVTDKPVTVVCETDDMIVINKPAGMPVHPAGRYHYNSVVEIMRFERGGWNPMRMFDLPSQTLLGYFDVKLEADYRDSM